MTKTIQTVVCAWCGKVLVRGNSQLVSHGICPECKRKMEAQV